MPMSTTLQSPTSLTLSDRILGTDPKLRKMVRRTLFGAAVYLAITVLRVVAWFWGAMPGDGVAFLFVYEFSGVILFVVLQRTGWSKRFADPAMTLAQILFALGSLTISYALLEITRGASLQLSCLILVFGMYYLSPKQIFFSGLLAVGMLVAMLFVLDRFQLHSIDIGKQTLNIVLATVVLPVLSYIGQQVSTMRRKQIQQGKDLTEALRQLEQMAMRDTLTGLINRRCIMDMLGSELKRSQRTGQRFCLAVLDIDFFKRVNDTYGHNAGDAVLIGLAADATLALRKTDVIARWGGEEFLLMLPNTTTEFAQKTLSRLSLGFAAHDWAEVLPAGEQITVSMGLAESEPNESLEILIARADKALYAAKSNGRDCVVIAESGKDFSA
jgi:diguanylate cyclase